MQITEKIEKKGQIGKTIKSKALESMKGLEEKEENKIFFHPSESQDRTLMKTEPEFFAPPAKREGGMASDVPRALEIDDFSRAYQLTKAEIWQLVGAGELVAQRIGARIIVAKEWIDAKDFPVYSSEILQARDEQGVGHWSEPFGSRHGEVDDEIPAKQGVKTPSAPRPYEPRENSAADLSHREQEQFKTKPIKTENKDGDEKRQDAIQQKETFIDDSTEFMPESGRGQLVAQDQNTAHVALLIDHLSLAKEENREILRLTQSSLEHITKTTEAIIHAKDALISKHEADFLNLKTQVEEREKALVQSEKEIQQLKQQIEDLQMLSKVLSETHSPSKNL